jgi:hypothetical protein
MKNYLHSKVDSVSYLNPHLKDILLTSKQSLQGFTTTALTICFLVTAFQVNAAKCFMFKDAGTTILQKALMIRVDGGTKELPDQTIVPGDNSPKITKKGASGWIGLAARNIAKGNLQESYILIIPEATTGFDPMFDSEFIPGDGPRFYSLSGGEKLSTNSLPSLSAQTEIDFVFVPNQGNEFEIEATGLEMILDPVFLYDKKSRSDQNLSENPIYTFVAAPGDDSTRFMLHFAATGFENPQGLKEFTAWYTDQSLHFSTLGNNDVVIIYDMQGKMLQQILAKDIQNQSFPIRLKSGVYIIRLNSGNNSYTKKILVR